MLIEKLNPEFSNQKSFYGKAKLIDEVKQEGHGLYYHRAFVKCEICRAQGPMFYEKESNEYEFLALKTWNERSIKHME